MVSVSFLVNYAAKAVRLHWKAVLLFVVLQILFVLVGLIPFLGIIGDILSTLMVTSVVVFYGKKLYELRESVVNVLSPETGATDILFSNWNIAAGIVLASFVLMVPVVLFTVLTAFIFGMFHLPQGEGQTYEYITKAFVFFLVNAIVWSWYLYVIPYANGKAIVADSFSDAFLSFLKPFISKEQFKTINGDYFKLLFLSSLLLIVFVIVTGILFITIVFSPIAFAFVYAFNVYYGGMCVACYSLVTESELANA
ncbi:hypothetical protein SAMN06265339_0770 [Desulfurobacterium pacificum]|uniref:Glycerophosphoryl diester phosphodiesterase membrane domain-containing protein n=1 Tax=Desulfurobacterium pacificum TaxID=240166 RepID=A0ABY1NJC9_9BACT|nr:hypothetical protein [Desulfurobacterium pacificum]SMP10296.1 hypothetical protein SAMN06265339_0770 [Desulfurobacterium pacificum]